MPRFGKQQTDEMWNLIEKTPQEALQRLREFEEIYRADSTFQINRGGYLIDIGNTLQSEDLVGEGVDAIKVILPTVSREYRTSLYYNLANGLYNLHLLSSMKPDYVFDPDTTSLIQAKEYYRKAFDLMSNVEPNLQIPIRVNYGNCLSRLGRSMEAMCEYHEALTISPDYPMALGNLGLVLGRFAYIAHDVRVLKYAADILQKAVSSDDLGPLGTSSARTIFESTRLRIESLLQREIEKTAKQKHKEISSEPNEANTYIEFCKERELFLNFSLRHLPLQYTPGDTVSFSLITAVDDNATFPRLARIMNEVKERYATARWLVFEACESSVDLRPYDNITYYIDNLDYAVYGIRVAKLKLAFESAYNVLDKIAFFVNDYLGLNMEEHRIHFGTIWTVPRGNVKCLKSVIRESGNWHLYALYDVSRDLGPSGYLSVIRDTRNRLTHRYLVPHTENADWMESVDGSEYHIEYDELLRQTLQLLRIVRNAVIYLIAFIDLEEQRKIAGGGGKIMPQPVFRASSFDIRPENS